ncbi:FACT complex subunit Ssrp1 [Hondaea fermentalgiana]|uniref:FACT complex subunit SSRP1 n=1 Tax=Hondaea fermentalgiana TaxID=2315210 RepID=A0A2R5G2Z0_9STRA|nr:FACT complex subunit Ssrp1 [Hondaea fermentalgiana]|eukprot:GBG24689.1 FACT complex subunit Ssrp1 [Hondaea fermentalgiana]
MASEEAAGIAKTLGVGTEDDHNDVWIDATGAVPSCYVTGATQVAALCDACPEQIELVVKILRKVETQIKTNAEAPVASTINKNGTADAATAAAAASSAASQAPEKERVSGWCTITGQSFQVPRGNLDVELLEDGSIGLHSKSVNIVLPPNGIEFAYELPSLNSAASTIILRLHEAVPVGKSEARTLLLTPKPSPKSKLLHVDLRKPAPGNPTLGDAVEEEPIQAWRMLLASMTPAVVIREPDPAYFRSNQGKTAVKCYHNVKDGVLYPLPDGIAFVRSPTLFLNLPEIDHVDLQREVSGATRNFDLNIVMKEGTTHEIRMIERDEFDAISAYVARTHINDKHLQDAQDAEGEGDAEGAAELSDEEDEDSDFHGSDSENEATSKKAARVKSESGEGAGHAGDADEDEDEDDEDGDGDSSDGEDHESDIDSSDIELDKDVEFDETDTIALKRPKRKAALAAFPSSSSAAEGKRPKSEEA